MTVLKDSVDFLEPAIKQLESFTKVDPNTYISHRTLNRSVHHCWFKAVSPGAVIADNGVLLLVVGKVLAANIYGEMAKIARNLRV